MKINLNRLTKGEIDRQPFEFDYDLPLDGQFDSAGIIAATPIHIAGKVARIDSELILEMTLSGELTFQCSRCLDEVAVPVDRVCVKHLVKDMSDDLETVSYEGYHLDLEETIIEEIVVSLPQQVLCQEDCKGLCSVCGANLNHGDCGCDRERIDPRFEILDEFFS